MQLTLRHPIIDPHKLVGSTGVKTKAVSFARHPQETGYTHGQFLSSWWTASDWDWSIWSSRFTNLDADGCTWWTRASGVVGWATGWGSWWPDGRCTPSPRAVGWEMTGVTKIASQETELNRVGFGWCGFKWYLGFASSWVYSLRMLFSFTSQTPIYDGNFLTIKKKILNLIPA